LIWYKNPLQALAVFIHNRVFCTDVPFIGTENTVGARSAQVRPSHATAFEMPSAGAILEVKTAKTAVFSRRRFDSGTLRV